MPIESPYAGRLGRWLVAVGESVPVGATVARLEPLESGLESALAQTPGASVPKIGASHAATAKKFASFATRNGTLSPREKARARNPSAQEPLVVSEATGEVAQAGQEQAWDMSPRQARLGQLLLDSPRFIAEAWISMPVPWDEIGDVARQLRDLDGLQYRPSTLELIAWCVVQAMREHPKFRVLNRGEKGYELQTGVSLGLSVALPDDELTVAGLTNASELGLAEFIAALRFSVGEAAQGRTRPGGYACAISYMAGQGVHMAAPRVVLPSVATLFVGAPFEAPQKSVTGELQWQRLSNFVLAFDHRIINGAGAAAFLKTVIAQLHTLATEHTSSP
jgi:pyruvate/2-oxoglutarate dehydrogenase complex dihydrolipoamide acyltransferase (E2) component